MGLFGKKEDPITAGQMKRKLRKVVDDLSSKVDDKREEIGDAEAEGKRAMKEGNRQEAVRWASKAATAQQFTDSFKEVQTFAGYMIDTIDAAKDTQVLNNLLGEIQKATAILGIPVDELESKLANVDEFTAKVQENMGNIRSTLQSISGAHAPKKVVDPILARWETEIQAETVSVSETKEAIEKAKQEEK
ncbi:MAG: hypothetical protein KAT70_06805 [Thermoplasmata archaeon]|nr:hypothetical protein [Thermoplasmata archaeon]